MWRIVNATKEKMTTTIRRTNNSIHIYVYSVSFYAIGSGLCSFSYTVLSELYYEYVLFEMF
jgi:hypothetical protein